MTILVIGAGGMLGRAFTERLAASGRACDAIDLPGFDMTDAAQVEAAVERPYEAIVNCAAYTNVDGAETDEGTATRLNGEAVGVLARAAARRAVPLVHFSTDYVFNGTATKPYAVDEPHAPLNAYGRSKAVGERALWAAGGPHLLLRTSWLYAPWGNNFVRTIFKASRERDVLRVVSDQRGRPTSSEHLAKTTLALLERGGRGTLHVTDGGECTWFDFACEIVRLSGHGARVEPCTSEEFQRPARRPAYSVLDLEPVESVVGPMPNWRQNLASVVERLDP